MTMHIVGPYLTTTKTAHKKPKITKHRQQEIESGWRERNARLKAMGLPKETLEEYTNWLYGRGKKEKKEKLAKQETKSAMPSVRSPSSADLGGKSAIETGVGKHQSLGSWITGPVTSKQTPKYTGTSIIGIGTMHKSNAVPIFSNEEAQDISKMRRG
jgi:hypothetical protein